MSPDEGDYVGLSGLSPEQLLSYMGLPTEQPVDRLGMLYKGALTKQVMEATPALTYEQRRQLKLLEKAKTPLELSQAVANLQKTLQEVGYGPYRRSGFTIWGKEGEDDVERRVGTGPPPGGGWKETRPPSVSISLGPYATARARDWAKVKGSEFIEDIVGELSKDPNFQIDMAELGSADTSTPEGQKTYGDALSRLDEKVRGKMLNRLRAAAPEGVDVRSGVTDDGKFVFYDANTGSVVREDWR